LQLKIATWCKVIEDLLHNGTIVLEASHNRTCVDVVEGFAEDPVFFGIVDLEMTVCRDARCGVRDSDMMETGRGLQFGLYGT
jgi:hypothetical protein